MNFLMVEALERYHHFYGDTFKVECPTGSGQHDEASRSGATNSRAGWRHLPARRTARALATARSRYANDPHWRDLVLFYEYFHGDTGRGFGASHQTGWTALAAKLLENTIEHTDRSEQIRRETNQDASKYAARLARSADEVRRAQQLRFEVFNLELGEGLAESYATGLDVDPFDEFCDHLIVEEVATERSSAHIGCRLANWRRRISVITASANLISRRTNCSGAR